MVDVPHYQSSLQLNSSSSIEQYHVLRFSGNQIFNRQHAFCYLCSGFRGFRDSTILFNLIFIQLLIEGQATVFDKVKDLPADALAWRDPVFDGREDVFTTGATLQGMSARKFCLHSILS